MSEGNVSDDDPLRDSSQRRNRYKSLTSLVSGEKLLSAEEVRFRAPSDFVHFVVG